MKWANQPMVVPIAIQTKKQSGKRGTRLPLRFTRAEKSLNEALYRTSSQVWLDVLSALLLRTMDWCIDGRGRDWRVLYTPSCLFFLKARRATLSRSFTSCSTVVKSLRLSSWSSVACFAFDSTLNRDSIHTGAWHLRRRRSGRLSLRFRNRNTRAHSSGSVQNPSALQSTRSGVLQQSTHHQPRPTLDMDHV